MHAIYLGYIIGTVHFLLWNPCTQAKLCAPLRVDACTDTYVNNTFCYHRFNSELQLQGVSRTLAFNMRAKLKILWEEESSATAVNRRTWQPAVSLFSSNHLVGFIRCSTIIYYNNNALQQSDYYVQYRSKSTACGLHNYLFLCSSAESTLFFSNCTCLPYTVLLECFASIKHLLTLRWSINQLDRKLSYFLLIWLIRKSFSLAKYSSNTVALYFQGAKIRRFTSNFENLESLFNFKPLYCRGVAIWTSNSQFEKYFLFATMPLV